MVCTGNICRSPTAEGVLKAKLPQGWRVESCGTHDYHVGEEADERTVAAARKRGFDLSTHRARQLQEQDYSEFDLLLAMDRGHLQILRKRCPDKRFEKKIKLFLEYSCEKSHLDVPDPYYGGPEGFEEVLNLVIDAVDGLIRTYV